MNQTKYPANMTIPWNNATTSRSRLWDFRIEQKVFALYLSNDGGSVMISERTRQDTFELKVDIAAAVWLKETLEEALDNGDVGSFVRKYRGTNFVLIAEKFGNKKGVFMKFSRIRNGAVHHIMVPREKFLWGWKKMAECLGNIVGRRSSKGIVDRSFPIVNKPANIQRGVVKQDSEEIKNWEMANHNI